jgi:hypothetical protein
VRRGGIKNDVVSRLLRVTDDVDALYESFRAGLKAR